MDLMTNAPNTGCTLCGEPAQMIFQGHKGIKGTISLCKECQFEELPQMSAYVNDLTSRQSYDLDAYKMKTRFAQALIERLFDERLKA